MDGWPLLIYIEILAHDVRLCLCSKIDQPITITVYREQTGRQTRRGSSFYNV